MQLRRADFPACEWSVAASIVASLLSQGRHPPAEGRTTAIMTSSMADASPAWPG